jgi:hypothetical protein
MSEKPEWFQLTDGDQKPEPEARRASKRFVKIAAFTAPLLLVGGAMVFADGHDEEEQPNIDTTISTSTSTSTVSDATTNSNAVASKSTFANPSASKSAGVVAPGTQQGPGDGDHEGFFGDGDGDHQRPEPNGSERPHRERGEHGDRNGTAPTIPQSGTSTTKN